MQLNDAVDIILTRSARNRWEKVSRDIFKDALFAHDHWKSDDEYDKKGNIRRRFIDGETEEIIGCIINNEKYYLC